MNMPLILAGDVGGTKTWLGLFECDDVRPTPIETAHYATQAFDGLTPLVTGFVERTGAAARLEAASFGVAGPVRDNAARLTNVPWHVDGATMAARLGIDQVRILNDLEAMAHAVPYLAPHELAVVRPGAPRADGNAALIAPGTGLGEACLHAVDGRLRPVPSEAGHADFRRAHAPRVAVGLGADGRGRPGAARRRALGPGTRHAALLRAQDDALRAATPAQPGRCPRGGHRGRPQWRVQRRVWKRSICSWRHWAPKPATWHCGRCPPPDSSWEAALRLASCRPSRSDRFRDAFVAKGAMRPLLEPIPVSVIIEPQVALIGAAVHAGRSASIRRTNRE